MATKKSATAAKKPAVKKATSTRAKTTTKVTTVKASAAPRKTESRSAVAATAASPVSSRFSFSRSPLLAASIAEFIGAFLLAAVILAGQNQPLPVFFAYIGIFLAIAGISGAHINPIVTAGAWVTRRTKSIRAVSFLAAQFLGGLLALVVINAFVSAAPAVDPQAAAFGGATGAELFTLADIPANKEWLVLSAELLGATIFGFAVAAAFSLRTRAASAFGVASGFFIATFVAGYLVATLGGTAAVLNPSAAAALQGLSFEWWPIAVYLLAPVIGGILGFALHDLLNNEKVEDAAV